MKADGAVRGSANQSRTRYTVTSPKSIDLSSVPVAERPSRRVPFFQ